MKNAIVLASALLLAHSTAWASCTARVGCEVTTIECSGQSACYSGADWVQCDDQPRITCPVCQAQTTCCNGQFLYCNGYSSCEENPGQWIKCDGRFGGICPDCPNWGMAAPGLFGDGFRTADSVAPFCGG